MLSRITRAADSIWHIADLEHGDPYEDDDEAGWFRDRQNMYSDHKSYEPNEELMTLIPGWNEAKRRGWKPLGGAIGPMAYRGSGDNFEFIKAKHISPDKDHWERIPQRWMRYSYGEGGPSNPYVMHSESFKDAINDKNLPGWNIYSAERNPDTGEYETVLNKKYPGPYGPAGYSDDFKEDSYFDNVRRAARENDMRLGEGGS